MKAESPTDLGTPPRRGRRGRTEGAVFDTTDQAPRSGRGTGGRGPSGCRTHCQPRGPALTWSEVAASLTIGHQTVVPCLGSLLHPAAACWACAPPSRAPMARADPTTHDTPGSSRATSRGAPRTRAGLCPQVRSATPSRPLAHGAGVGAQHRCVRAGLAASLPFAGGHSGAVSLPPSTMVCHADGDVGKGGA